MRAAFATLLTTILLVPVLAAAQNTPPIADAGPDQSIVLGEGVALFGSATDPDGNAIVSWQWTIETAPAGSSATLYFATTQAADFFPDVTGEYVISLVVSDGIVYSAPDTVLITVRDILPPVAVASADVTAGIAPLAVTFDASGSVDNIGYGLTYTWYFGEEGSPPSTSVSPTHTYQYPGIFRATLVVVDSFGQSDFDTIQIHVGPPINDAPPIADAGPDQFIVLGDRVALFGSATDPDGNAIVSWQWTIETAPAGSSATLWPAATSQVPDFFPDVAGEYVISLVVSDGMYYSAPDTVLIGVRTFTTDAPTASPTATPYRGRAPLEVQFNANAFDANGDPLTYLWDFRDGTTSTEADPTHTFVDAGYYIVFLTVSDGVYSTSSFHSVSVEPATSLCGEAPEPDDACRLADVSGAGKSVLRMKDRSLDSKDALRWKWSRGVATATADFKSPDVGTATMRVCLYDGSGKLADLDLPAGGIVPVCGTEPCWKPTFARGFKYKNKSGSIDGIYGARFRGGPAGKSEVQVRVRGKYSFYSSVATGSLSLPVTIQLLIDDGFTTECFKSSFPGSSGFGAIKRQDAAYFYAKGP